MRKIFIVLLSAIILTLPGCQKDFTKSYDLSVDANKYSLSKDGESFHIYVYCSGTWMAGFDDQTQDWIRILPGTDRGKGIGLIRIEADQNNTDKKRTVNLVIRSGNSVQTVELAQKYVTEHWDVIM